ncbi:MAG: TRAM domain-containing protein, partial [Nitrospirae bacterium]
MAAGGAALGRHRGRVVFADGALPGERVRLRLEGEGRGYLRGRVL